MPVMELAVDFQQFSETLEKDLPASAVAHWREYSGQRADGHILPYSASLST
jgi:hypothetical protein